MTKKGISDFKISWRMSGGLEKATQTRRIKEAQYVKLNFPFFLYNILLLSHS